MSVVKNLMAGSIQAEGLFPYPRRAAVESIFNNPIKGFGVFTDYAEKRRTQATGVGLAKIQAPLPEQLRDAASGYERYTVQLANTCELLLRKHGKSIVDRQQDLRRVAGVLIDLFVGLCNCRVPRRCRAPPSVPRGTPPPRRARSRSRQNGAWRAMCARIERNEDEELDALARFIIDKGCYPWDVVL